MLDARRELYKTLDALDYHARRVTLLTTQVRAQLVGLSVKPPPDDSTFSCSCKAVFLSERALAIHRANVHGGPAVPLDDHELEC